MKLSKKRVGLFSSAITAILVSSILVLAMQNTGIGPTSKLAVYAAGTPDAYDNRIGILQIYQNTTGSWAVVATLSTSDYVPSYTLTIPANQQTIIEVGVILNSSLARATPGATPDLTTAEARTRVYITISGVVTSGAMILSTGWLVNPYYFQVVFDYPSTLAAHTTTWIPVTDTTYTVTILYQAYY
jgi:hypothetical protein